MTTLLLDIDQWDLVLDANGNVALASEPYALAQDVASAVRTFLAECIYNTELGIPYFEQILGKLPPTALLIELIQNQALTVPDVVTAQCVVTSFNARGVTGSIQFVDTSGVVTSVNF